MSITKDMILKNNQSGATDTLYIMLDERNENLGYLLTYNNLMNYCSIEVYFLDPKLNILTIYDYFYNQNMTEFDTAIDFFHDMSDKEKLLYLLNRLPWQLEECHFKQMEVKVC